MIQKPLKKRIQKIAEEFDVDPKKIEEIEAIMWKWVKEEISKGRKNELDTFENIYLRFLGTFHVQGGKVKYLKENNNDK